MSSKQERQRIIKSGSPLRHHKLSQEVLKDARDLKEKVSNRYSNKKAVGSRLRKELLFANRIRMQDDRAVQHIFEGNVTPQDLDYVAQREQVIDRYTTPKGTEVTIAIFDFTHTEALHS